MSVTFSDLEVEAPALGQFLRTRIEATGLCFLGTVRSDGGPRVSPIELFLCDGRLYCGSMPDAVKVQDLRRDARCCIVTPLADKDDTSGEGKAFCRAREITDPGEWDRVRKRFLDDRGFDMGEPGVSHLFELAIDGVAHQRVEGDDFRTTSWAEGRGIKERRRTGPLGESIEDT
jgi:hypothetical protein